MSAEFTFSLIISNQEYQRYYSGDAKSVQVRSEQGLLIQFPASSLKPFVTHNGISGKFLIKMTNENKIISLKKISK